MQEEGIEFGTVVKLYNSLLVYFNEIREQFDAFEKTVKSIVDAGKRKLTRKTFADDGDGPSFDALDQMTS